MGPRDGVRLLILEREWLRRDEWLRRIGHGKKKTY